VDVELEPDHEQQDGHADLGQQLHRLVRADPVQHRRPGNDADQDVGDDDRLTELDTDTPAVRRPNVTRLQVYGWPDLKAVRVMVDVAKPWVFGFEPLYAEGSVSTHSARD
jgi:hypothetical protein